MVLFLEVILHQYAEHTISYDLLKLEIKKGYKTPFRRSSHICGSITQTTKIGHLATSQMQ